MAQISADQLTRILQERIPGIVHLEVTDDSGGCGAKFSLFIVSSSFEGVSLLDRQRKVNEVLKEELKQIHALSMRCWTPKQWEDKKAQAAK